MDLVAEAKLPIAFDNLREALEQFIAFVRKHCVSKGEPVIHIFVHETACKSTRLLAEAFPPDYLAFGTDPVLDRRKLLNKSDFLSRMDASHLKDCACDATLTDFLNHEQALTLLEKITATLSPSGRGIMLQVHVSRAKLSGVSETVRADLAFSKWRSGARRKEATIRAACPAQNRSDREAKQTLSSVAERLGLNFKKPSFQPPLGLGSEKPAADSLFVALKAFQAAFDLAIQDVQEKRITLESIPLLLPRVDGARKRMEDAHRSINEQIDAVPALKRLIRERLPEYEFEASDEEFILFAKTLTSSLEGILALERFHHQGLGKSFTAHYGVRFPRNPELQPSLVAQAFRDSIFTLFHTNMEHPAWTYSTGKELEQVLAGCGDLLSTVLPLLEKRTVEMLSPLPAKLPVSLPSLGRGCRACLRRLPEISRNIYRHRGASPNSGPGNELRRTLTAARLVVSQFRFQAKGSAPFRRCSAHRRDALVGIRASPTAIVACCGLFFGLAGQYGHCCRRAFRDSTASEWK
jgi:hypothetical protein